MNSLLLLFFLALSFVPCHSSNYGDIHKEAHQFREELLKQHKPDEKIGDFKAEEFAKEKKVLCL